MESLATLSTAQSLALFLSVAACGLALGEVPVAGIRLGAAGVLFTALLAGALGLQVDHQVIDFLREFGLMLFVFMLGLQLGPGFMASRLKGLHLRRSKGRRGTTAARWTTPTSMACRWASCRGAAKPGWPSPGCSGPGAMRWCLPRMT